MKFSQNSPPEHQTVALFQENENLLVTVKELVQLRHVQFKLKTPLQLLSARLETSLSPDSTEASLSYISRPIQVKTETEASLCQAIQF